MQTDKHHDKPGGGPKPITFTINSQDVSMTKGKATGAEIKEAAIRAGVAIEADFPLYKKEKGDLELVDDGETVGLKEGDEFTALAPDDVS